MKFCDCGDLGQLISSYKRRKKADPSFAEYIPESFIWHAFLALIDGLHFLTTGTSYLSVDLNHDHNSPARQIKGAANKPASWRPIVHRDIKPDNVMLKSRSTPGSRKPLYVILTDFGMADREAVAAEGPPVSYFCAPARYNSAHKLPVHPATKQGINTIIVANIPCSSGLCTEHPSTTHPNFVLHHS